MIPQAVPASSPFCPANMAGPPEVRELSAGFIREPLYHDGRNVFGAIPAGLHERRSQPDAGNTTTRATPSPSGRPGGKQPRELPANQARPTWACRRSGGRRGVRDPGSVQLRARESDRAACGTCWAMKAWQRLSRHPRRLVRRAPPSRMPGVDRREALHCRTGGQQ